MSYLYNILHWYQFVDKSISWVEIPTCCQTPFSVNKLAGQSSSFAFPKRWIYIKVHFLCDVSLFICHIACHMPTFPCVSIVRPYYNPEGTWKVKEFSSGSCKISELSSVAIQWKWGIFLLPSIVTLHSHAYKYKRTRRLLAGRLESLK